MWRTGASAAVFSKKMHAIWPDIYNHHPKISQMVALLSAHRFVMIRSSLVTFRCLFIPVVKLKSKFIDYSSLVVQSNKQTKRGVLFFVCLYDPHPKISQMVALLSAHRCVMIKSRLVTIGCLFLHQHKVCYT